MENLAIFQFIWLKSLPMRFPGFPGFPMRFPGDPHKPAYPVGAMQVCLSLLDRREPAHAHTRSDLHLPMLIKCIKNLSSSVNCIKINF